MNLKQGIRLLIFAILIIAAALGLFSHGGSWSDNFVFRLMAAIPFSITFFCCGGFEGQCRGDAVVGDICFGLGIIVGIVFYWGVAYLLAKIKIHR